MVACQANVNRHSMTPVATAAMTQQWQPNDLEKLVMANSQYNVVVNPVRWVRRQAPIVVICFVWYI